MASSPSLSGIKWESESVYKVCKPSSPQLLPGVNTSVVTLSVGLCFTLIASSDGASDPSQATLLKKSLLGIAEAPVYDAGLPCSHCGSNSL